MGQLFYNTYSNLKSNHGTHICYTLSEFHLYNKHPHKAALSIETSQKKYSQT